MAAFSGAAEFADDLDRNCPPYSFLQIPLVMAEEEGISSYGQEE